MVGDAMAPMRRNFALDEFIAEAEANAIGASVVVQTVSDITETEELLDLAAGAWLSRAAVRAGLREVARRALCNEFVVVPYQLHAVLGAISGVTESKFVLDHLAKPPIASHTWEPWADQLAAVGYLRQRLGKDLRPGDRSGVVDLDDKRSAKVYALDRNVNGDIA